MAIKLDYWRADNMWAAAEHGEGFTRLRVSRRHRAVQTPVHRGLAMVVAQHRRRFR